MQKHGNDFGAMLGKKVSGHELFRGLLVKLIKYKEPLSEEGKSEAERKVIDRMTGAREPSLLAFSCEIRVRNYGERIEELERKIRRSLQD